jgi:hypothetical protein
MSEPSATEYYANLDRFPAHMAPLNWTAPQALRMKVFQASLHHDPDLLNRMAAYEQANDLFATLRFGARPDPELRRRAAQLSHLIHELQGGILARLRQHAGR